MDQRKDQEIAVNNGDQSPLSIAARAGEMDRLAHKAHRALGVETARKHRILTVELKPRIDASRPAQCFGPQGDRRSDQHSWSARTTQDEVRRWAEHLRKHRVSNVVDGAAVIE